MPKGHHVSAAEAIRRLRDVERLTAGGMTVQAACRELGIVRETYYKWRNRYAGMTVKEAERAAELRRENERLKRLIADQAIKIAALEDVVRGKP